jgi:hypothetical protein
MRVRLAVIAAAMLVGCGGATNNGTQAAASSAPVMAPAGAPAATSPATLPATPAATPATPDATTATPATSTAATPPETTAATPPAPTTPPAAPPSWAGTQALAAPWTEGDGVAVLPTGGLLVYGSQFLVENGRGSRHGTLAWTDATGKVERTLGVAGADDIYAMAVSPAGAIALAGYTQGTGGYLMLLDASGAQKWLDSLGPVVALYGVAFAANGDVVACGSDSASFIGRWTASGSLLWLKNYPVDASGFSFGLSLTPSGDIAAAGGSGPVVALLTAPDGTTLWTRTLAVAPRATARGAIATDSTGAVLLAGHDGDDAFVAKLDAAGTIAWQTGVATSGVDTANAIAVDAAGNAVVAGSYDLGSGGSGTGYVARYSASGAQLSKTDVDWPGIEVLNGVALDGSGNAFVVGSFPSDSSGFQTEGFVVKLTP